MKMKLSELRGTVRNVLVERDFEPELWSPRDVKPSIDIWSSSYAYNSSDDVADIAASALDHHKKMMGQGTAGPNDPRFLNVVSKRLKFLAVPDDVSKSVLFKLRMMK